MTAATLLCMVLVVGVAVHALYEDFLVLRDTYRAVPTCALITLLLPFVAIVFFPVFLAVVSLCDCSRDLSIVYLLSFMPLALMFESVVKKHNIVPSSVTRSYTHACAFLCVCVAWIQFQQ